MLVLLSLVVGGWLAVRAVSAAVCADYNSISNDFCDKWHYDTPPEDAIPVPPGWSIAWQDLSCGSGGCPSRMYVLVPPSETADSIHRYIDGIRGQGWRESETADFRKGELFIQVDRASENAGTLMVPKRLGKPGYVFVSLAICGEAIVCS